MGTTKTEIANALLPILSRFQSVGDRQLQAVNYIYSEGSLDRVLLDFGAMLVLIKANEGDDTIDFEIAETVDLHNTQVVNVGHQEPWQNFIGRSFGWGWAIVNQQGYCDGLLLSFNGLFPRLILNVAASSIKVGLIEWIKN
jgi:hypothetical protein